MPNNFRKSTLVLLTLLCFRGLSRAQVSNGDEFTFVRFKYTAGGVNFERRNPFGRDWIWWTVDYPSADQNFMEGLKSWTAVNVADDPVALSFLDSEIFRYSFAYAVEVGYMTLTSKEAENLREWLLRGGFLMVDDFHGPFEWHSFVQQMKKVFPKRAIRDIPLHHPIFHCFYDFETFIQIPGLGAWLRGVTYEKAGINQRCMGIFDDQERLMVLVMRNVDLGDAWEHAKDPRYPPYYSAEAFKLGINFVIYALTH